MTRHKAKVVVMLRVTFHHAERDVYSVVDITRSVMSTLLDGSLPG